MPNLNILKGAHRYLTGRLAKDQPLQQEVEHVISVHPHDGEFGPQILGPLPRWTAYCCGLLVTALDSWQTAEFHCGDGGAYAGLTRSFAGAREEADGFMASVHPPFVLPSRFGFEVDVKKELPFLSELDAGDWERALMSDAGHYETARALFDRLAREEIAQLLFCAKLLLDFLHQLEELGTSIEV